MNYLVFLDKCAGELEKILSGVKSMVVKEFDPDQSGEQLVRVGDNLYFLRNNIECAVRVKATVVRVLPSDYGAEEDLSRMLKELQPRLQLTEDQYNYWSGKKQALFVEFEAAHKVQEFHVVAGRITDRKAWIAFEEIHELIQKE